jgi:hypothetical protein
MGTDLVVGNSGRELARVSRERDDLREALRSKAATYAKDVSELREEIGGLKSALKQQSEVVAKVYKGETSGLPKSIAVGRCSLCGKPTKLIRKTTMEREQAELLEASKKLPQVAPPVGPGASLHLAPDSDSAIRQIEESLKHVESLFRQAAKQYPQLGIHGERIANGLRRRMPLLKEATDAAQKGQ